MASLSLRYEKLAVGLLLPNQVDGIFKISINSTTARMLMSDVVCKARLLVAVCLPGRRPADGVEDAVVGPDPVAAEVEGPVHGEEDVVVDHLGLVVQPRLLRLQAHHVHDLRDPEAPAPVRPDDLSGWGEENIS